MQSIQPYSLALLSTWTEHTDIQCDDKLLLADSIVVSRSDFSKKAHQLASLFRKEKRELSILISNEMGKPICQSQQEIEKCALCCEYYAENSKSILEDRIIESEFARSFVRHEPYGVWLAIMPWNFPFWQVIRCAIPCLAAGNKLILKHASNVQGCAFALEKLFLQAGFLEGEFQNLCITSEKVTRLIENPIIKGVSFTGSEQVGRKVASKCGEYIKPVILELGGSNALIITESADIEKSVNDLITGRFQNNGQSCIAAKRLLVHKSISNEFTERLLQKVQHLKIGDPLMESTFIGPLAKPEFNEVLLNQLKESIAQGAKLLCGGEVEDGVFRPTLISHVKKEMRCMQEELFGPVLPIYIFENMEEAIHISNSTAFGLGVSIYGENIDQINSLLNQFEEGAVFINSIVKSDPRFPFGGVKQSGIGRELGQEGLLAFTQLKTVIEVR